MVLLASQLQLGPVLRATTAESSRAKQHRSRPPVLQATTALLARSLQRCALQASSPKAQELSAARPAQPRTSAQSWRPRPSAQLVTTAEAALAVAARRSSALLGRTTLRLEPETSRTVFHALQAELVIPLVSSSLLCLAAQATSVLVELPPQGLLTLLWVVECALLVSTVQQDPELPRPAILVATARTTPTALRLEDARPGTTAQLERRNRTT